MTEVALFPIPECVAFPGMTMPLHVFEPRYRAMVHHCVAYDLPIAVCHTDKMLRPSKSDQTTADALQTNQATYKPCTIFSAGRCEILQTLADGRMAIAIHVNQRLQRLSEIQSLPFTIARCEPYDDKPMDEAEYKQALMTQEKIMVRLRTIMHKVEQANDILSDERWINMDVRAFSFEIFGLLRMPADVMQSVLEMQDVNQRLHMLLDCLNLDID